MIDKAAEAFFDEIEKLAIGQGRFAQGLKKWKIGRGARNVVAATEKTLRRRKSPTLKAMAHTMKDMSMGEAMVRGAVTAPALAIPVPGAHPAAMVATKAPSVARHRRGIIARRAAAQGAAG